jgi:hypothetical protein
MGWLLPERRASVDELLESLNSDPADEVTARRTAAVS